MAYQPTTWQDGHPPALEAQNLNKIEQGIKDAHDMMHDHEQATGGTHGIPPGESFESTAGAQARADAARDQAIAAALEAVRHGGPTADRPTDPELFESYFDTDLGHPIWWNGTQWVDAMGQAV